MRFAIIESGVVVNIALALEPQAENWIQSDTASIGDLYDGTTFTKPELVAPPIPSAPRVVTKLQYMGLFRDWELEAIYSAAKSVIAVEIWLDKFKMTPEVDLDDPRTIGGLQAMEAAGLIGPGRAAEIASGTTPAP